MAWSSCDWRCARGQRGLPACAAAHRPAPTQRQPSPSVPLPVACQRCFGGARAWQGGTSLRGKRTVQRRQRVCRAAVAELDSVVKVKLSLAATSGKLDLSDCELTEVPEEVFAIEGLVVSGHVAVKVGLSEICSKRIF